jgi:hypothetical protein
MATRPTPESREITATPITTLMMAVKILLASGAGWVNGAAAATTSASPVIQAKNVNGRGVPSRRTCSRAVASSAQPAASPARVHVNMTGRFHLLGG